MDSLRSRLKVVNQCNADHAASLTFLDVLSYPNLAPFASGFYRHASYTNPITFCRKSKISQ